MKKIQCPFAEASYKERLAFQSIQKELNIFPEEFWTINQTPYEGNDTYDVNVQDKSYKSFIIEIKIRGEKATEEGLLNGFIYETKKHNALLKIKSMDPNYINIKYMCFTTKGTYVWNVEEIKLKKTKMLMNKATMSSTTNKEMKSVYLLDIKDAEYFEYTWKDIKYWDDEVVNKDNKVASKSCKSFPDPNMKFLWEL